jgi:hypothetical protein
VKLFANEMNASDKIQAIPNWMIRILGVFIPFLREMPEMMYQFDRDFNFDSTKFINKFGFVPTPNKEAVAETIQALRIVTPQ